MCMHLTCLGYWVSKSQSHALSQRGLVESCPILQGSIHAIAKVMVYALYITAVWCLCPVKAIGVIVHVDQGDARVQPGVSDVHRSIHVNQGDDVQPGVNDVFTCTRDQSDVQSQRHRQWTNALYSHSDAEMLKKVMVKLRLTSPPSSRHHTLLPEPPGEHAEQIKPKPNRGRLRSSVMPTQNPIWKRSRVHEKWMQQLNGEFKNVYKLCRGVGIFRHHELELWLCGMGLKYS